MESSFKRQFKDLCFLLHEEMIQAHDKNGPFNSLHEAYAVLLEEVDELWDEVKKKRKDRSMAHIQEEAIQIAASALRLIIDSPGSEK